MAGAAVMLCGHGSRDPEAIEEFERAARRLRPRLSAYDFAAGYLEFARPTIRDGLAALAARGARRIYAAPAMLFAARHVKNDLPSEMSRFAAANPGIEMRLARDLAIDAKLLAAAAERIAAVAGDRRDETLLVVVGRGTSDPDANAGIGTVAQMLRDGMGFGGAEAAFSGIAQPRVAAALRRSAALGFKRVVVFPYFLFTGILVKRIYAETDAVAAELPAIDFAKARCLGGHDLVLDALADRVEELARSQG